MHDVVIYVMFVQLRCYYLGDVVVVVCIAAVIIVAAALAAVATAATG